MPLGRLFSNRRSAGSDDSAGGPRILILTPIKDAIECLDGYFGHLRQLAYPHERISIGMLEGDSVDGSYEMAQSYIRGMDGFRRVELWKKDYGFSIEPDQHRTDPEIQAERRAILARSRNQLLSRALRDEDWVLWMDVDVIQYPPDLIERLLATGKRIVHPHCVIEPGGPTFDKNGWREFGKHHMDSLRDEGDLVPLDAVGGTVLFIDAELHREGLIFPPWPYGRAHPRARDGHPELETEGLGLMAQDMGETPWGMPNLEVLHRRA